MYTEISSSACLKGPGRFVMKLSEHEVYKLKHTYIEYQSIDFNLKLVTHEMKLSAWYDS